MSSLLPPNATQLERLAAEAGAAGAELPVILRDLWDPEDCPEHLLPWLAWAWSADSWSDDWSARQKRNTIAEALAVQQIKGTIGAVRQALGALGFQTRVQEWHRQTPKAEPYTFRLHLDVDQDPMDQRGIQRALEIVERTKSLRSHLDAVIQQITTRSTVYVATATNTGAETDLGYTGLGEYSNGWYAIDLMTDAAYHGEASTVAAIDRLRLTLHSATYRSLLVDADLHGEASTVAALDQLNATLHTANLTAEW
jgi:phage tail P2-like protein